MGGRSLAEIVAPSFDEVVGAARSGLFDSIGHIDVVKRYLWPHVTPDQLAAEPELYDPILRALIESGTALEVNTSGLRHPVQETLPVGGDRRPIPGDGRIAGHRRIGRAPRAPVRRGARRGLRLRRGGRPRAAHLRAGRAHGRDPGTSRRGDDGRRARFELVVLGAGPAFTDHLGATGAAYLLRHADGSILLDLGQGSFPRLAHELEPSELDAILVSHLHPDHFVDLVPLRHYLRWHLHPARPRPRPRACRSRRAPRRPARRARVQCGRPRHRRAVGGRPDRSDRSRSRRPSSPTRTRATGCGWPSAMDRAWSTRATAGEPTTCAGLMRPGDVLLCEVSFGAGPVPNDAAHLAGPDVGRLAAERGARAVLLTHLLMGHDRAETIASVHDAFDGPVRFVEPGDRLRIEAT